MAYERTNWQNGDVISSEKLNKMEAGIEYACSLEHEVEDPTDGQLLKYDAEKEKFVNSDVPAAIETNIQNPTDGQTLKYDAASGKWVNGEGGGSTAPLIVNGTLDTSTYTTTLDKTWKEIHDAFYAYTPVFIEISNSQEETLFNVLGVIHNNGVDADYVVYCTSEYSYRTLVENGYPSA